MEITFQKAKRMRDENNLDGLAQVLLQHGSDNGWSHLQTWLLIQTHGIFVKSISDEWLAVILGPKALGGNP